MSDEFAIPSAAGRAPTSAAYRARRAPAGTDGRWLMIAAAALGALLLVGMGGWAMFGRRPATIPVIEADARPLRVKPTDPGGMQVAGAEEMDPTERMAPSAETPAPEALRAQMQAGATPAPAAPRTAAPVPAPAAGAAPAPQPAPGALAAPGTSPLPDTPARPAAKTAPVATPATASSPKSAAGAVMVQLAAVDSEAVAQTEWQRLIRRMPDLLSDRRPVYQKIERDGRTIVRIRTGGFADIAEATEFCGKLKAKGGNCAIASF